MIKFTEIYSSAGRYDSTAETVVADYYLREILVNPRYIMTAVENTSLSDKNKKNPLMDGLDPVIRFTEIKMLSNVGMTSTSMLWVLQNIQSVKWRPRHEIHTFYT